VTEGSETKIDDLVMATGFDAMTGALSRIPINGRDNISLNKAWEAGPRTYLGLMTHGFPNFFTITGPGSPSVLSNMLPTIEHHVEWIAECIDYLQQQGIKEIEADLQAQNDWVAHGNEIASKTLRYSCSSWYLGANVPGKPRVFMPYIGGMPAYRKKCAAVVTAGYEGFCLNG
jgi:cation diffusion facilitator CzcD-associated flavoprotein CzcO